MSYNLNSDILFIHLAMCQMIPALWLTVMHNPFLGLLGPTSTIPLTKQEFRMYGRETLSCSGCSVMALERVGCEPIRQCRRFEVRGTVFCHFSIRVL